MLAVITFSAVMDNASRRGEVVKAILHDHQIYAFSMGPFNFYCIAYYIGCLSMLWCMCYKNIKVGG